MGILYNLAWPIFIVNRMLWSYLYLSLLLSLPILFQGQGNSSGEGALRWPYQKFYWSYHLQTCMYSASYVTQNLGYMFQIQENDKIFGASAL